MFSIDATTTDMHEYKLLYSTHLNQFALSALDIRIGTFVITKSFTDSYTSILTVINVIIDINNPAEKKTYHYTYSFTLPATPFENMQAIYHYLNLKI